MKRYTIFDSLLCRTTKVIDGVPHKRVMSFSGEFYWTEDSGKVWVNKCLESYAEHVRAAFESKKGDKL